MMLPTQDLFMTLVCLIISVIHGIHNQLIQTQQWECLSFMKIDMWVKQGMFIVLNHMLTQRTI